MPEIYYIAGAAIFCAVSALLSAFFLLFIGKIGLRDYVVGHAKSRIVSELFGCDFCMSFWTNLAFSLGLSLFIPWVSFGTALVIPALAAPVTRILL